MNIALITAGGIGSRTGLSIPKQFVKVCGKPLFIHTLKAFNDNVNIDMICLVCHKDWIEFAKKYIKKYRLKKVTIITEGSDTFNNSIKQGINELIKYGYANNSIVLIHESNRPLVSDRIINENIMMCEQYNYVTTVIQSPHVIMKKSNDSVSDIDVLRSDMVSIQSPNTYRLGFLNYLYNTYDSSDIVATTGMVNRYTNAKHHLVYGDEYNGMKITTKNDLDILKNIIYGRFTLCNITEWFSQRRK